MATHAVAAMASILRKHREGIPEALVTDVADFFQRNNPSFDRERFLRDVADEKNRHPNSEAPQRGITS